MNSQLLESCFRFKLSQTVISLQNEKKTHNPPQTEKKAEEVGQTCERKKKLIWKKKNREMKIRKERQ